MGSLVRLFKKNSLAYEVSKYPKGSKAIGHQLVWLFIGY